MKTEKDLLSLRGKARTLDYPEDVILKYPDRFNWDAISAKLSISKNIDSIIKYRKYICFYDIKYDADISDDNLDLLFNDSITMFNWNLFYKCISHKALIKYHKHINNEMLAKLLIIRKIDIDFIINNYTYHINNVLAIVAHSDISATHCITDVIPYNKLIENEKYIDFYTLSNYYNLPDEIIDRYHNKINWSSISKDNKITDLILTKYADRLDFHRLIDNENVPYDFLVKNIETFANLGLLGKLINLNRKIIQYVDIDKYINLIANPNILISENTTEDFLEKYYDKFSKKKMIIECKLSNEFLEKHFDDFDDKDIEIMCKFQKLSKEFIDKHIDKLDKTLILINNSDNIDTDDFIEKYKNDINFMTVLSRSDFDENIIEKYYDYLDNSVKEAIFNSTHLIISGTPPYNYIRLSKEFIERHKDDANTFLKYKI